MNLALANTFGIVLIVCCMHFQLADSQKCTGTTILFNNECFDFQRGTCGYDSLWIGEQCCLEKCVRGCEGERCFDCCKSAPAVISPNNPTNGASCSNKPQCQSTCTNNCQTCTNNCQTCTNNCQSQSCCQTNNCNCCSTTCNQCQNQSCCQANNCQNNGCNTCGTSPTNPPKNPPLTTTASPSTTTTTTSTTLAPPTTRTTPVTTPPPDTIRDCPEGTILIGGYCQLVYCPSGTVMSGGKCIQIVCPDGTVWSGYKCSTPEPISHNITLYTTITTKSNHSQPDINLSYTNNITVNAPVTINQTEFNDNEYPENLDTTTPPPTPAPHTSCCTVVTPRTCERRNNRWYCYHTRNQRCGDFCTASVVYLKPPHVYSRPNVVVVPPLQEECGSPLGLCGQTTGGFDCSACGHGIGLGCSSYCYRYNCPTNRCGFYDQQAYCLNNPGSFGCMQDDGCFDEWCS
ncbi:uncharacterized protein [Musca autumnalis]|uniref:uncharacterized protein n=1 Tax=Musca autumnalis TaxID=221902 RepID=UPI003CFB0A57